MDGMKHRLYYLAGWLAEWLNVQPTNQHTDQPADQLMTDGPTDGRTNQWLTNLVTYSSTIYSQMYGWNLHVHIININKQCIAISSTAFIVGHNFSDLYKRLLSTLKNNDIKKNYYLILHNQNFHTRKSVHGSNSFITTSWNTNWFKTVSVNLSIQFHKATL